MEYAQTCRSGSRNAAAPGSLLSCLPVAVTKRATPDERVRAVVLSEWGFVGRLLRHWGVRTDLDDAIQQVFITFARKEADIELGKERAFLAGTAIHIAARARRAYVVGKRREEELQTEVVLDGRDPEQLARQRQDLQELDRVLGLLSDELRAVFLMYEVEEMTMREIAEALELPPGTVASRLRRARAAFEAGARRE